MLLMSARSKARATRLTICSLLAMNSGSQKALEICARGAQLPKIAKGGAASVWDGVNK
jgi:hypothetical protein